MGVLKITGIRIENFRKFKEPFELSFLGPAGTPLDYVVLAGPNGCGKTTVLEAILLALQRDELLRRDLPPNTSGANAQPNFSKTCRLTVSAMDVRHRPGRELALVRGRHIRNLSVPSSGQSRDAAEDTERIFEMHRLRLDMLVEYISSRRMPALVGAIQVQTNERSPDGSESNRLWLLKHRILQQQSRRGNPRYAGPEPLDEVWLYKLNEFWRTFRADGTEIRLDVVAPENLDVTEWDLFLTHGEERICAVDSLSSGEQEVLAMAAPFITQDFDGLLLIDEPELHLHPQWQGRIMPALRALCPKAQIIVATHADDPWDDAYSYQRFLLVPDSDPRSAAWRDRHADQGEE